MEKKELNPALIGQILRDNIKNSDTVFVFSTDISTNSWADWCVTHPEESGVKAVRMEHFIAWDKFKEKFVVAQEENKHAIPALLRKAFVYDLITKNAKTAKENNPIFKKLISPEFAGEALSYADWIKDNISSLKMWYDRFTVWASDNPEKIDDEDRDYLELYNRYRDFLGEEMFEPSWLEASFKDTGKHFIIFYPEQFSDFDEYETLLTNSPEVELFVLPKVQKDDLNSMSYPHVYTYSDARQELRRTMLKIREIISSGQGKVSYPDIAIHVPDMETYKPYIKRELENYCIPYVLRSGESLINGNAGSIFEDILSCYRNNFSYDAVRGLLLNGFVPWKEDIPRESLIRRGMELHVVCNYERAAVKDQWEKALAVTGKDELELRVYKSLKKFVTSFCEAKTFDDIEKKWFEFKANFLNSEFSEEADNTLSRCIVQLQELVQIEKDFIFEKNMEIPSPYSFFVEELKAKKYTPQTQKVGVNVFDYKVAACSAFEYNFVINCNQSDVSIMNKKLSFLNGIKREQLGIKDVDTASGAYLRLYGKFNNEKVQNTIYSCSEESFNGFAIPHNFLQVINLGKNEDGTFVTPFQELDKNDFWLNEKALFMGQKYASDFDGKELSDRQIRFVNEWVNSAFTKKDHIENDDDLKKIIEDILKKKRHADNVPEDENKITQSDMDAFFPCPRKWILSNVLKLKDDTLEAVLFNYFDQGNINHKVLELLFQQLEVLPVYDEINGYGNDEERIESLIRECVQKAIHSPSMSFRDSPLVIEILESQSSKFEAIINSFMKNFCQSQESGFFGGCKVVSTEKWITANNEKGKFGLSGKIDCVLMNDEDEIIIVDYKNTSVKKQKDCWINEKNELSSFQCAMYVNLWNLNNENCQVSKMVFKSITKEDKSLVLDDNDDELCVEKFAPTLDTFNGYADLFNKKIEKEDFEPKKGASSSENVDPFETCSDCRFKNICRTTYTVGGQEIKGE